MIELDGSYGEGGDQIVRTALVLSIVTGKSVFIDIGTAGSITLLLQSILLPCFFADKEVSLRIRGDTDTKWAVPFYYFREVFVPRIEQYCNKIEVELVRCSYYPKGMVKL